MKRLLFVITIITQTTIFAQTPIEINSLDSQRNCWYHFFEETQTLQLADFGGMEPVALRVSMLDLKPELKENVQNRVNELKSKVELKGEFESYLFCNSGGHVLVVNAHQANPPIVYTTRVDRLDQGDIYSGSNQAGFTMGSSAHSLIIKHKKNISSHDYKVLINAFFKEQVAAIRFMPNANMGKLRVSPEYYLKLQEVKKLIENHSFVGQYTEYLELSPNQNFSGEHGLLFKGQFE